MKPVHAVIGGAASIVLLIVALPGRGPALAESDVEPDPPLAVSAEPPPVPSGQRAVGASREQLAAQAMRRAQLVWRRDPFAPPRAPEAPEVEPAEAPEGPLAPPSDPPAADPSATTEVRRPPLPRLSGISRRGAVGWAIIDHDIVRVGDVLPGGYRVASIEPRGVTLVRGTERLTLTLGGAR